MIPKHLCQFTNHSLALVQYLHKSLVLCIADEPEMVLGLVLNRPSGANVKFRTTGQTVRINLGGEQVMGSNQMLLLHRRSDLKATSIAVGDFGLKQISVGEADKAMQSGEASAADFLVVSGLVVWPRDLITQHLSEGTFVSRVARVAHPGSYPPSPTCTALSSTPSQHHPHHHEPPPTSLLPQERVKDPATSVPWDELFRLSHRPVSPDDLLLSLSLWKSVGEANAPEVVDADDGAAMGTPEEARRGQLADQALAQYSKFFLSDA